MPKPQLQRIHYRILTTLEEAGCMTTCGQVAKAMNIVYFDIVLPLMSLKDWGLVALPEPERSNMGLELMECCITQAGRKLITSPRPTQMSL